MWILEALTNEPFVLLKKSGDRVQFKGLFHKGSITSFDPVLQTDSVFQVEKGDGIERTMPVGGDQRYVVQDAVLNTVGPSHVIFTIKVEQKSGSPKLR